MSSVTVWMIVWVTGFLCVLIAVTLSVLFKLQRTISDQVILTQRQVTDVMTQVNQTLLKNAETLRETHQVVGDRLDGNANLIGAVRHKLGRLEEGYTKIYEMGKGFSSLQEILQAPKIRGGWGEFLLQELLSQMLPPSHYTMQYTYKSGDRVDAVIHLSEGLIPVDAKFPLENFKRMIAAEKDDDKRAFRKAFVNDVKKRVDEIASRYILPNEGTFDFAFMYIPAENVWYETIIRDESLGSEKSVQNYALEKRVFAVSPGSFYAYLTAIVHGLNGLKIEAHAREILQGIQRIGVDLERFAEELKKLGTHLRNSVSSFDKVEKQFEQLKDRFSKVESHPEEKNILHESLNS
jgi:DNA recombination protein RmuC